MMRIPCSVRITVVMAIAFMKRAGLSITHNTYYYCSSTFFFIANTRNSRYCDNRLVVEKIFIFLISDLSYLDEKKKLLKFVSWYTIFTIYLNVIFNYTNRFRGSGYDIRGETIFASYLNVSVLVQQFIDCCYFKFIRMNVSKNAFGKDIPFIVKYKRESKSLTLMCIQADIKQDEIEDESHKVYNRVTCFL